MKATTTTTSVNAVSVLPGTPQVNSMEVIVTPLNGNPEGVSVSFYGQLKTNLSEAVIKITMPSSNEVTGASPDRSNSDQADVSMNDRGRSSGPAYVGVTLNKDLSEGAWEFTLALNLASGSTNKYRIKRM